MGRSLLLTELLREGRSIRIPIIIIFYNAILAFITILFIFFNNESMVVGYYMGSSPFFTQFLIISSFQILLVILMMPFSVSYMEEMENAVRDQFMMIPGVIPYYIMSRMAVLMMVNLLVAISSLPIISLSCIYSGISLLKLFRFFGMIVIFSFWSGSIAIFFYQIFRRNLMAFAGTLFTYLFFTGGLLLFLEMVRGMEAGITNPGEASQGLLYLCLLVNLFNPLVAYMGYFGNLSGNISMITSYFGNFGIDATSTRFSFLYYKAVTLVIILTGIFMLYLTIRHKNREIYGKRSKN